MSALLAPVEILTYPYYILLLIFIIKIGYFLWKQSFIPISVEIYKFTHFSNIKIEDFQCFRTNFLTLLIGQ